MNTPTSTTLPIPPDLFWAIAGLGGCALFALIIYGFLIPTGHNHVAPLERVKQRLGLSEMNSGLFLIALTLWGAIFLSLSIGLIWLIWEMIWMGVPEATPATWDFRFALARLAGMTATLGAVVALPFTLVRVRLNAEQTRTAQEGLITDRINKAVEGLGAVKAVKRQRRRQNGKLAYVNDADGNPDLSQPIMEEVTEPNLEVRIGAIYALERIAQDSLRDHVQVMEILCAYIRNNHTVKEAPKPPQWKKLRSVDVTSVSHSRLAMEHVRKADSFFASWTDIGDDPDDTGELESWTNTLSNPRADIQAIVDVVCRRTGKQKEIEVLWLEQRDHARTLFDFSGANLQKCIFFGTNISSISFADCALDGAQFEEVTIDGVDFTKASLAGILFYQCEIRNAQFNKANLTKSAFTTVNLFQVNFVLTDMNGVTISTKNAEEIDFFECGMEFSQILGDFENIRILHGDFFHADFRTSSFRNCIISDLRNMKHSNSKSASFSGCAFFDVSLEEANPEKIDFNNSIGDASVALPENVERPSNWFSEKVSWSEIHARWSHKR